MVCLARLLKCVPCFPRIIHFMINLCYICLGDNPSMTYVVVCFCASTSLSATYKNSRSANCCSNMIVELPYADRTAAACAYRANRDCISSIPSQNCTISKFTDSPQATPIRIQTRTDPPSPSLSPKPHQSDLSSPRLGCQRTHLRYSSMMLPLH